MWEHLTNGGEEQPLKTKYETSPFMSKKRDAALFMCLFSVIVEHSVNHCFSILQRRLCDWLIPLQNIPPGTFLSACKCKKPILALSVVITFIVRPMFLILCHQFSPEIISEWMWFLFVRSSEQSFFLKKNKKTKRRTCCPGLIICFWLVFFVSLCWWTTTAGRRRRGAEWAAWTGKWLCCRLLRRGLDALQQ